MPETPQARNRTKLLMAVIAVVLLAPLIYAVASSLFAQQAEMSEVFLEMPDPKHEKCVAETVYMRYHHWELLREIREEVVRYGKRGEVGLYMCKDCHTSRERFCNKCHNAVSAYPDCFGCHHYP
jgi:hypothetical protein